MADSTEQAPSTTVQVPDSSPENLIVLHYLVDSRSQRILWLLEELGVPYELKRYERGPDRLAPPELKAIHPLGAAPVLTDGDTVLAESGLIVEYLISKYGPPQFHAPPAPSSPSSPPNQAHVDNLYFTHYAEGTLMPLLVNKMIFSLVPARVPFLLRPIARVLFGGVSKNLLDPRIATNIKFIDKHLSSSSSPWFAHGPHPTSADFMMSFPLEAIGSRAPQGMDVGEGIRRFVSAVHERPAYKKALEKGGPYAYGGKD